MVTRTSARPVLAVVLALAALAAPFGLSARSVAGPDDWEAKWNKLQPADKVMDAVGIRAGDGGGGVRRGERPLRRAGRRASRSEGQGVRRGHRRQALEYLRTRCERDTISNIETILGAVTDPKLPPASCDFVYCINTYHHIEEPVPLLRNIIPALKPAGRLVIIEHSPAKIKEDGVAKGIHTRRYRDGAGPQGGLRLRRAPFVPRARRDLRIPGREEREVGGMSRTRERRPIRGEREPRQRAREYRGPVLAIRVPGPHPAPRRHGPQADRPEPPRPPQSPHKSPGSEHPLYPHLGTRRFFVGPLLASRRDGDAPHFRVRAFAGRRVSVDPQAPRRRLLRQARPQHPLLEREFPHRHRGCSICCGSISRAPTTARAVSTG